MTEQPADLELTAPRKRRVFDQIASFLQAEITSGRLEPGARLKPERELAADLKVSRASLREALKALEMLGVVEIKHGLGVYVAAPKPAIISGQLGTLLTMQPSVTDDILEARIALECHAARLACQFASRADHQRMQHALDQLSAAAERLDGAASAAADYRFHKALVDSTKSIAITFLYDAISAALRVSHGKRWEHLTRDADFEFRLDLHHSLLQAIRSRDEELAYTEMLKHFVRIYAEMDS